MPYFIKEQLIDDWKTRRGKFKEEYPPPSFPSVEPILPSVEPILPSAEPILPSVDEPPSVDNAWKALDAIYTSFKPPDTIFTSIKPPVKRTFHDASRDENHPTQQQLWLARHDLFYAILIELSEQSMVTLPGNVVTSIPHIALYKIENFGSAKSTSDIDACIQYDGSGNNHVSWVIRAIEDRYVELKCPCLDLDIEFYDSYISRGNPNQPEKAQTYTVTGVQNDEAAFKTMLPYALASMMRNVYLGNPLEGTMMRNTVKKITVASPNTTTHRQQQSITPEESFQLKFVPNDKQVLCTKQNVLQCKFESIRRYCQTKYESFFEYPITTEVFGKAENLCLDYFTSNTYDEKRHKYYKNLENAETLLEKQNQNNIDKLLAFSKSQLYRQEGYICVTTVMHVPRVMQQCKNDKTLLNDRCLDSDGNNTHTVCSPENKSKLTYPSCILGDYDYILSMIEQLGFMLRYYLEAGGNLKDKTYMSKFDKYKPRWDNAASKLTQWELNRESKFEPKSELEPTSKLEPESETEKQVGGRTKKRRRQSKRRTKRRTRRRRPKHPARPKP